MKKTTQIATVMALLILGAACGSTDNFDNISDTDAIRLIEDKEKVMFSEMGNHTDSLSKDLLDNYDKFSEKFPQHDMSPEFKWRAGNVARSLNDYDGAIARYQSILDQNPGFEKVTEAHFLIAFVYDNDKKDKTKAREIYQTIADKYPDHIFGKQAIERLKTLDMTDKELIEHFNRLNKTDSLP